MAKVNGREDALLNAYLNRYQTAQASNVSTGRSTTRKAQQQGSAIMNATDKTLPVLHNSYTETLNNIVQGASLENSLNNDILNRQMKLAQAKFDAANDLYQQQQKAQQYAAKKAAKAAKSSGKSSGKNGSTTGTGSDTESAASLDALFGEDSAASTADTARNKGGNYDPKRTNAERNASARARYDDSKQEKSDIKYRAQQKAERTAQLLKDKQTAANAGANKDKPIGNSYAERQSAAQPAQSHVVTRGGKAIGSSYAIAGSAPSAAETQAAKDKRNDYKSQQEDIASALKKLQSDADYRAELATPGRKLTSAEVAAVNQYEKSTKNTGFSGLKRVFETAANKEGMSQEDYAKKTAAMNAELNQDSALRGKAQMNGAGQTAQAFTAGLYDSVPFLTKSVDKLTDIANETGAELPQFSNAIEGAKSYDPLAAAAGTLVGKGMQYNLFNTAMAGTPLAKTMGKAGNAVVGQAQKIPVLGDVLGAGAGDALGRILTDTTADLALDTLPSLVNDVSDGKSAGEIAGNTAKNIAGNVAMNALPEIGGTLFNRLKGTAGDAAQDALKQADNAVQDVQSAAPARNIVQPEANGTTGLAAEIQQMNTPDAANRSALNTLDELRGQVNLNGAQEKEAEQLRRAVLQRQQEIGDEAKLALQNTDSLPIDATTDTGYNNINNIGGVTNEAVQGRNQYDGTRSEGILQGSSDGTPQSGQRLAVGAESGEYLPANRVLVAEHLNQRPSVYNDSTRAIAEQAGAGAFDFRNSDDAPETFAQALATAKANNVNGAAVDGHTAEEISNIVNNGGKTFLVPDGTAGGAVEANGNLTCVFKDAANNSTPGAGSSIALAAVNNGATKGDCYGRALVNMYSKAGLEPVARIPYAYGYNDAMDAQVRKQIADGIINKEPDVYALKLRDGYDFEKAAAEFNTAHRYTQAELDALPVYDDYDEMLAYRDSLLKAPSADAGDAAFLHPTEAASEPVLGLNVVENARQTAGNISGQNAARPLNGSESVPENAVGAESTQYNRREVLNQDYANQRAMGGKIDADEAAAAGIGQQTHTVYSRAEGKDTAKQDFDLLVQQNGDILSAGRTVADELARKSADGNFDASDVYRGYYAADQLQNMMNSYEKGSADAQLVQAQIENLNRAVSAGQSKNAQALSAGRWAQIDEYTPIRKFEQITQRKVNDFAKTRDGKQLESLASDVVEMAKSGPQDEEFTAFLKAQSVDVGDNPLNAQMDDLAKRIKRMADTKGIKATDEQAKSAAANILAGGNADDVFNAMARKTLGIENLSQEDYDYVKNAFAEMANMPDSKARYEKEMDAYKRLTKYLPAKTFGDKMESIRYLSMLGNTRTHARNVLGNVSMGVVTRAKDNVSGVMQLALPKDQRTKAVGTTLTADGRKMVDLAKEYGQNKMYSVLYNDGKFNAESGLRAVQDTFTSKPGKVIQKAADINSALLEKEDNIFLTSAFGNAMASQLKARGYDSSVFTATDAKSKQALVDAAATALRDAKEATFHEDNFLSTALKNFQNDIKGHGVGGKILWAVGEGVLPFKKTPLNIAKNAMEYNIVGGTVEAAYRYATGASNADVIDAAAKGLTGTALMGIGGILAYNGLLNGSKSGDDRADAFNEMTGKQEYSINIPGKGTYTIDWASPASVPLLMGAEIANEWQNGGLSVTKFLDAARKIGNPILDTTMLQGLNDTLDSVSYADSDDKLATLLGGTLSSYAQQYVPTAFGQIARTIDPMRRSTYGGGDSKTERDTNYAIRKAENKIPGLSMNNEPYIDQWGREQASLDGTDDSAEGMFRRGVYNMLSPGYIRQENITPVDEYLQGLYGSTNDSHVYPEKASSKITVDSDDYYMTPEEKTEYAKTSGQAAYDLVDELRQNSMFLRLPEDQQSALVQDAYKVAKTAGGVAAVGDGVSGVNAKEYEAYRDNGAEGFSQYVLMKNATDLVRDEKRETSGNDDATLNTVEKWNTLYSQFGDDAVSNFVNSTDKNSTVRNISDLAGDKAVTAYMQAYSAVAKTLDDDQTPDKFTVGYGMQKYGLSGDDFARAYLAAYYKKDKNGKYPEKGGTYADKAGAEIYQSYGADALRDWVNYRATIPDTNGNGKADKGEAVARLKEMDLTNEMRRAYLAKTNKQWGKKNPF
jgi:hypothetical protein